MPGFHEGVFQRAGVHQDHIGVAVLAQLERLACAHGDHINVDTVFFFKHGQDHVEQAGIARAGGGGEHDAVFAAGDGNLRRGSRAGSTG